jgi:hypothetical protein
MDAAELARREAEAAEVRRELARLTVGRMGLTPAGHLAHAIAHIEAAQNGDEPECTP